MDIWRILGFSLLLLSLISMGVHYEIAKSKHSPYPTIDELQADYGSYVGEPIYLWARVVDPSGETMIVKSKGVRFTIRPSPAAATTGDAIQIYGIIERNNRIYVKKSVVSPDDRIAQLYAVSGVAVLLSVGLFFMYWTIDWRRLVFIERSDENHG